MAMDRHARPPEVRLRTRPPAPKTSSSEGSTSPRASVSNAFSAKSVAFSEGSGYISAPAHSGPRFPASTSRTTSAIQARQFSEVCSPWMSDRPDILRR
jgi:hypothetical protein